LPIFTGLVSKWWITRQVCASSFIFRNPKRLCPKLCRNRQAERPSASIALPSCNARARLWATSQVRLSAAATVEPATKAGMGKAKVSEPGVEKAAVTKAEASETWAEKGATEAAVKAPTKAN
jgi:hypothetical protein